MKNKKITANKKIHDVNNLLTNIILSSQLLGKDAYGKLNAKQKKCLKGILDDAKKINQIAKQLTINH